MQKNHLKMSSAKVFCSFLLTLVDYCNNSDKEGGQWLGCSYRRSLNLLQPVCQKEYWNISADEKADDFDAV